MFNLFPAIAISRIFWGLQIPRKSPSHSFRDKSFALGWLGLTFYSLFVKQDMVTWCTPVLGLRVLAVFLRKRNASEFGKWSGGWRCWWTSGHMAVGHGWDTNMIELLCPDAQKQRRMQYNIYIYIYTYTWFERFMLFMSEVLVFSKAFANGQMLSLERNSAPGSFQLDMTDNQRMHTDSKRTQRKVRCWFLQVPLRHGLPQRFAQFWCSSQSRGVSTLGSRKFNEHIWTHSWSFLHRLIGCRRVRRILRTLRWKGVKLRHSFLSMHRCR